MFEEMWLKHEGYNDMVREAWERRDGGGVGIQALWRRLREVSMDMKRWSVETFGSVRAEIKRLKAKLELARADARFSGYSPAIREIEQQLHETYEKEEVMYRQRSRQEWLKAGDKNTKFFQNRATHRKRKNTVLGLKKEDGSICKTNEGMAEMALAFYHNLYASQGSSERD
jgi:Tfp pilus assembly protein FimT